MPATLPVAAALVCTTNINPGAKRFQEQNKMVWIPAQGSENMIWFMVADRWHPEINFDLGYS